MDIINIIQEEVTTTIKVLYGFDVNPNDLIINVTKKEFEGDYTLVTFPFTKLAKKAPQVIAQEIGEVITKNNKYFLSFNVIKGFLNVTISDDYWKQFLNDIIANKDYGKSTFHGKKALVEFSSPNTNKPLHLGHIRNILLGWSTSQILEAAGYEVVKVQIINDRGIAICKSMIAWEKFGNNATPSDMNMKSDHFVGHWYVTFEKKFQEEYKIWQSSPEAKKYLEEKNVKEENIDAFFKKDKNNYFNNFSKIGAEAKEMLRAWEAGDEKVRSLWQKMNNWVYEGFDVTYDNLGVSFDKLYYESNTYLLGKDIIENGLKDKIFYKKEDGSVWIDLEDAKLDHKLVLRSDGTSVYMTQDIGTAHQRYENHQSEKMIYVVADEQNYHFQALFAILQKLGEPYAKGLHHLSYGMVNLPSGRMKSREGTVVDADDLMQEVINEAKKASQAIGSISDMPEEEQELIFKQIGLAALKFFIIKVNPVRSMIFDPSESLDLQGQTGPSIQYAAVRVKSAIRKAGEKYNSESSNEYSNIQKSEKEVLLTLHQFPTIIREAAENYNPSDIANYCYTLAKAYNKFWASGLSMLNAESDEAGAFRLKMSAATLQVLTLGMQLLGIEIPERM